MKKTGAFLTIIFTFFLFFSTTTLINANATQITEKMTSNDSENKRDVPISPFVSAFVVYLAVLFLLNVYKNRKDKKENCEYEQREAKYQKDSARDELDDLNKALGEAEQIFNDVVIFLSPNEIAFFTKEFMEISQETMNATNSFNAINCEDDTLSLSEYKTCSEISRNLYFDLSEILGKAENHLSELEDFKRTTEKMTENIALLKNMAQKIENRIVAMEEKGISTLSLSLHLDLAQKLINSTKSAYEKQKITEAKENASQAQELMLAITVMMKNILKQS